MSRRRRSNPLLLLSGGGGGELAAQLDALFAGGGDDVAFRQRAHTIGSALKYWDICIRQTEDRYVDFAFSSVDLTLGVNVPRLTTVAWRRLLAGYNHLSSPAITESVSGTKSANATALGGFNIFSNSGGYYAELVYPVGTYAVGVMGSTSSTNTGIALVEIDGDPTAADLLPTAQNLVNSGALDSAALVANGGTLNPTDRVIDQYSRGENYTFGHHSSNLTMFTETLDPETVHTVRITRTGYKNTASSSTYVLFQAFVGRSNAHRISNVPYVALELSEFGMSSTGVIEISYNTTPTGATLPEWMGHTGSMKFKVLPSFTLGGSPLTPTDDTWYVDVEVSVGFTSSLRHSEIDSGNTEIGTLEIEYAWDATNCLTISHTLTWAVDGTAGGYPFMMTGDWAIYDRRRGLDFPATAITAPTTSQQLTGKSKKVWLWDTDGKQGALMSIDLSIVDNWQYSQNFWFVNTFDTFTKLYAERFNPTRAFSDEDVWIASANFRYQWFEDGADALLA